MNHLYYGDNLEVLRKYIPDESVDLCYIDPPFNSKRNYNQIYNNLGKEDYAQSQAFVDTWVWDELAIQGFSEIIDNPRGLYSKQTINLVLMLEKVLGMGSLLAYLVSIMLRCAEIYRVLKSTGSFYFHCDPTASHYIKIVLDSIFCSDGGDYKNEITWKRTTAHNDSGKYGNNVDIIFFYTKGERFTWNQSYSMYSDEYKKRFKRKDSDGRKWTDGDLTAKGLSGGGYEYEYKGCKSLWRVPPETMRRLDQENRLHFTNKGGIRLKRYLDEMKGLPLQCLWDDISPINSQAKERLGYPTQKPEALLERIIQASSHEGDVVLDAYCGCGTTVAAAQNLNRRWIGVDITYQAISLIIKRLSSTHGKSVMNDVKVAGMPRDIEAATALANRQDDRTRKEFEKWAVQTYSNNRAVVNSKKGADRGVDGFLVFLEEHGGSHARVIFQVKSGHVGSRDIRDLYGTMTREDARMGVFITLKEPTSAMLSEAKQYGLYTSKITAEVYPTLQIITIEEILSGKRLNMPMTLEVFRSMQKLVDKPQRQLSLLPEVVDDGFDIYAQSA
ncbi:MAG: site-specific DNA-methyltransferase [Leptolyngbya sp. SIO1D8]|nr:site-specific DNA-methyltransferase [Leptolyngbya sp. SIO1D8]